MIRPASTLSQALRVLLFALAALGAAHAATGVLLPRDRQAPDPSILSLEEMSVDISIENGDARVSITQIFLNHTAEIQEGTYNFPLPGGATISDFAVWDGPVRIPAVILERRRAEEVYRNARLQAIDPGLLQMGERNGDTPETALFSAKIVPIPAFGTKRLELEYHQRIDVSSLAAGFILPLKPDAAGQQTVHHFHAHIVLQSPQELSSAHLNAGYPYKVLQQDAHALVAGMDADNLNLTEDLTVQWQLQSNVSNPLAVLVHRDPASSAPPPDERSPSPPQPQPGFFQATLLLGTAGADAPAPPPSQPRTFVLLFDNSLSMQWDKLERSFSITEAVLRSLRPTDRFNVLLFNDKLSGFAPEPVPADQAQVGKALDFIRASRLRGGTDLGHALSTGLSQLRSTSSNGHLVLITDGNVDRGDTVLPGKLAAAYTGEWKALPGSPHTDVFAIGDDANAGLLKLLAKDNGIFEHVLSTEPLDLHLRTFLFRLSTTPVTDLTLTTSPTLQFIYPLQDSAYAGSTASWVGQYMQPATASFSAHGVSQGTSFNASTSIKLPAQELAHPQLPRLWAQARVDALLDGINREGETAAAIDEIIRLARRYKLVTPYTSFLAVPRSLLRPRVIRPGDPVLRVRTDPAICSVIAIFPFGLTKPLRHLGSEDVPDRNGPGGTQTGGLLWETRFLAPSDMADGTYNVRLILHDVTGNVYRENKSFVIASTPPTVRILLRQRRLHRGEIIPLRATASASTRSLTARLEGVPAVTLRWDPSARANVGPLVVPPDMPLGTWKLTVTAEDVAHNLGTAEVRLDVVP